MEMIKKLQTVERLYPLYKGILTDTMSNALEMYFFDDLSLAEISKELNITRNAVHNNIKKAISKLETSEEKIGFFAFKTKIKETCNDASVIELRDKIKDCL